MKFRKALPLAVLATIVGCSSVPQHKKVVTDTKRFTSRGIASAENLFDSPTLLKAKVTRLMDGIYQGRMLGQVHLFEFDKTLDEAPEKALSSENYASLMVIRDQVEHFEEDATEFYLDLVMTAALPKVSEERRKNAQEALSLLNEYMDGIRVNRSLLPENLRPMILGSLIEKQTEIYDELDSYRHNEELTEGDENAKRVITENMARIRATRREYVKQIDAFKITREEVELELNQEHKKKSFLDLKQSIKESSEKMMKSISIQGRGTSSDVIYPTASSNGNITGSSFPANTWSITYDDGPGGATTPQVLKNLKDRGMKATFFVLAKQAQNFPAIMKQIKDEGHDIASHSYTHAQLTKVGPEQLEREITTARKVIETYSGQPLKLFRLPYGAGVSNSKIRAKIAENKMVHVFWTVDTLDWQDKNPQSIYDRSMKQMRASGKNAGIILFHDIHRQSVTASTMLMDYFQNNKQNKVCSVQGVVDQMNKGLPSCK